MMQNKHFQLKLAFLGPEKGMVYVIGAKFAMFLACGENGLFLAKFLVQPPALGFFI